MYCEKWTIRGVSDEARAMVDEIRTETGIPFGRLISMAIVQWYESLDYDEPVAPWRRKRQ